MQKSKLLFKNEYNIQWNDSRYKIEIRPFPNETISAFDFGNIPGRLYWTFISHNEKTDCGKAA